MVVCSSWLVQVRTKQQTTHRAQKRKQDGVLTEDRTPGPIYTLKFKANMRTGDKREIHFWFFCALLLANPFCHSVNCSNFLGCTTTVFIKRLHYESLPEEKHPFSPAQSGCSQELHVEVPGQVQQQQGKLPAVCKMNAIQLSSDAWGKQNKKKWRSFCYYILLKDMEVISFSQGTQIRLSCGGSEEVPGSCGSQQMY